MFAAPRFVAVDDRKEHLDAIIECFQHIGSPCIGIHFKDDDEFDRKYFRGVRCLFLDLHLVSGQMGTDHKADFGRIQTILEDNINENGGPFVLVLWTAHPYLKDDLIAYLEKNIDPKLPHAQPLAVLGLAKSDYIQDLDAGGVSNPDSLRVAVENVVMSNPQLAALLSWETDVLAAASETLASLLKLVPKNKRTSGEYPVFIDTVLSRLVRETVGRSHVDVNPRTAISMGLAPILSDRILNQSDSETKDIWSKAITRYNDDKLGDASPEEAGEINRMLHLALPGSETILSDDWGVVVEWPYQLNDAEFKRLTGLTKKQILCEEFKLRSKAMKNCKLVLIRVGAACDYAQNHSGPVMFLLGVEIPENAERQQINGCPAKCTDAIWKSPVFLMPGKKQAFRLYVHIRFPQTCLTEACCKWKVRYRLREQLLMQLINTSSNYNARPGIVQL